MKHQLLYALGLISLGMIGIASGPAGAVNANGPYYATPSWDQKLPASTRFIVLSNWNNEAVLDRETGLVWERSPSTTAGFKWDAALNECAQRTVGGREGWRLPSVQELASLTDLLTPAPGSRLPAGHPFLGVQATLLSSHYGSATTYAPDTSEAWIITFATGGFTSHSDKISGTYVWCVRGGGPLDNY
jgi:Protein of unknown function (DUF1566)